MTVLGIETSCDETAVGIVEDGRRLLANTVVSQIDIHKAYGGVVPEVAARSHIEAIIPTIDEALNTAYPFLKDASAKEKLAEIDAVAVTQGAGLGGSLLIGVMTARALAISAEKPLYAINHIEAHVYANFLTEAAPDLEKHYDLPLEAPRFPMLALIVSGGHTQLVLFYNHFNYTVLGKTMDDAIGEAFDKVAKMIGLPYPGGPSIAAEALKGNPKAFDFPIAKMPATEKQGSTTRLDDVQGASEQRNEAYQSTSNEQSQLGTLQAAKSTSGSFGSAGRQDSATRSGGYDFSYSGLKTAVLRQCQACVGADYTLPSFELPARLSEAQKADIAASFQRAAVAAVVDKTVAACNEHHPASVVIAGGVASNDELRSQLAEKLPIAPIYTDKKLCTDNGAMVATLGCFKAMNNQPVADPYSLEIKPNLKM